MHAWKSVVALVGDRPRWNNSAAARRYPKYRARCKAVLQLQNQLDTIFNTKIMAIVDQSTFTGYFSEFDHTGRHWMSRCKLQQQRMLQSVATAVHTSLTLCLACP